MKRLTVFAAALLLASGTMATQATANESDVVADARSTACVSENPTVESTIRIKVRNTSDEPVHMYVEIANRSMAASPPLIKEDPWYTFEDFVIDAHRTAFVTYDVGPDTLPYTTWVIKVWKDAPFVGSNIVFSDGYLQVWECGPRTPAD